MFAAPRRAGPAGELLGPSGELGAVSHEPLTGHFRFRQPQARVNNNVDAIGKSQEVNLFFLLSYKEKGV